MAKQSGLGQYLHVNGYDLSGDIGQINSASGPHGVFDVTPINKSAYERIGGRVDGQLQFTSFFNDANIAGGGASDQEHIVLRGRAITDGGVTFLHGAVLGNPCAFLIAKQINYDGTRGADGSLTHVTQALGQGYPLYWGKQITAGKVTHASATTATGIVDTADTEAGCALMLQYFGRASGTPTVVIEDSDDTTNGVDGTWATLHTFNAGGATPFPEFATVSGHVGKGVRVRTTGTFSNAVIAVGFYRGQTNEVQSF